MFNPAADEVAAGLTDLALFSAARTHTRSPNTLPPGTLLFARNMRISSGQEFLSTPHWSHNGGL
jgi:hypothetical protein